MRYRGDIGSGKVAVTGLLLALAATLGLVESVLMPPLPIPGLRLGMANLGVVVALALLGPAEALAVSFGRVAIVGLATGTLLGPASAMSLGGAAAAWLAMSAVARFGRLFSPIGWSVAGAAANVLGQLVVASLLAGALAPFMLLPLSLGLSLPSGLAVGYLARPLISRISQPGVSFVR